jgi:lysophospholipase L1-like esterase
VADRLGPAAFDADGMHLTRAAYQELVPEIADAIEASTE